MPGRSRGPCCPAPWGCGRCAASRVAARWSRLLPSPLLRPGGAGASGNWRTRGRPRERGAGGDGGPGGVTGMANDHAMLGRCWRPRPGRPTPRRPASASPTGRPAVPAAGADDPAEHPDPGLGGGGRGPGTLRRRLPHPAGRWSGQLAAAGRRAGPWPLPRYDERTATCSAPAPARACGAGAVTCAGCTGGRRRAGGLRRLLTEFPGIGPTGADIFLREVQTVWSDLRPSPTGGPSPGPAGSGCPPTPTPCATGCPPGSSNGSPPR